MRGYLYFPGCTLRTVAKDFDASAKACAESLGMELREMQGWLCCGAVFSNTVDVLMTQSGPNRILARARAEGDTLVTLCAGCHNVLKRTSLQAEHDSAKQTKIIDFNEEVFQGGVNVLHFLEILRDRVGPDAVKEAVKKPLEGLPVGAYYGCLLLRPSDEMRLDDPHRPSIIETLLESVGCVPVDFPSRTECCGSYLGVGSREAMTPLSRSIVQAARSRGARVLAVSCPLCKYNLEVSQRQMGSLPSESDYVPTVYFTQLLGLAFGHEPDQLGLNSIQLQAIRGVTQPTVESVS